VPACGFADCTRAASDPARPALRPVREELATGERRKIRSLFQKTRPEAEPRPQKPRRVPRRSAERRARPQADDRGNANHPWRAPHRSAGSGALIRSAGAEVIYAPLGAPPPYLLGQLSCSGLAKLGCEQKTRRENEDACPHPRSGGGGPREARWRGRRPQRVTFVARISLQEFRCKNFVARISLQEFRCKNFVARISLR
jgi:hypothetical protein